MSSRIPKKRNSIHPGEILEEEFLKPLAISQKAFAKQLGGTWTQQRVNAIVQKRERITEEIARDFSEALGTSPQFWLNLQNRYDLCQAKKTEGV